MNRVPFGFREAALLIQVAFRNWLDDRAQRMGAALAYYIALSLAPMILILLAITRWALGNHGASGRLMYQIQNLLGERGAQAIQAMVGSAPHPSRGVAATVLGLVTLAFAASAVVDELTDAMNTIWRVGGDRTLSTARTIFNSVKGRIVSFVLVLASGLFLVTSLLVNAWLFAAGRYLNSVASLPKALLPAVDRAVSFVLVTALFALIFKALPRVRLRWGDVAIGAVGTALLFVAGKFLLGLYFGEAGFAGTYGPAGSLVVVLVWVYYSAQVLFLGAEFTRAYAYRFGSLFVPENHHGLWQAQRSGCPPTPRGHRPPACIEST